MYLKPKEILGKLELFDEEVCEKSNSKLLIQLMLK
jgi:hypothetical protein